VASACFSTVSRIVFAKKKRKKEKIIPLNCVASAYFSTISGIGSPKALLRLSLKALF
jgi:hypothetical protein